MIFSNSLGWIGNLFFLWGVYSLGKKNIKGFYYNSIGNILYVVQSLILKNVPLLCLSIGLIILNIKGIVEWTRKKGKL